MIILRAHEISDQNQLAQEKILRNELRSGEGGLERFLAICGGYGAMVRLQDFSFSETGNDQVAIALETI